jgi:hypothetical protein
MGYGGEIGALGLLYWFLIILPGVFAIWLAWMAVGMPLEVIVGLVAASRRSEAARRNNPAHTQQWRNKWW